MGFGLSEKLLNDIAARATHWDIGRVTLFGSRARGDFRDTSDIDLAVTGGNADAFALDLMEEAPTLLGFDIVNLDGAAQDELRETIRREGVVIYEKV